MNECNNLFPEQSGLYIAQRGTDIILLRIVGVYPMLQISRGFVIDSLMTGHKISEASKEAIADIELSPQKWTWIKLNVDTSVFPKIAFDADSNLALSNEEYLAMRSQYYRLCQQGVAPSKITRWLMYEHKLRMEDAVELERNFDADIAVASDYDRV